MVIKKSIGIDLGTDTTQVYLEKKGIVVNEPSIVAYNNKTNRVVAHGSEAKKMLSRTPAHITALRPITHGVIADFEMAKDMVERFLANERIPRSFFTRVLVSVPTNLTEEERKSVEYPLKEAGAKSVYGIEQPLAAAFGSQLDVGLPTAYLIVDIGAGTTDMAIISLGGIVVSRRLKIAGNYLDQEIIKAVREEMKLSIGEPTAEEIKIAVGSAIPTGERLEVIARGRDVVSGLPREITIKDTQVRYWLARPLKMLIEAMKDLIESAPPELVGDIFKNGIYLCGGGSLLRGFGTLIEREIGVTVRNVEDPLTSIARGTGFIIENFDQYEHVLNNFPGAPKSK